MLSIFVLPHTQADNYGFKIILYGKPVTGHLSCQEIKASESEPQPDIHPVKEAVARGI